MPEKKTDKSKGIPLGSAFTPIGVKGVLDSATRFQDMVNKMIKPQTDLLKAAATITRMTQDLKTTAEKMAFLSKFDAVNNPYLFLPSGLYGNITKSLYDVEEEIEVLEPEILENESLEIEQDERKKFERVIEELKNEIVNLRTTLDGIEKEREVGTKMSLKNAKTFVFGQTFRNQDFCDTQEYSEMIILYNTLNKDPHFELEMEVMRGNQDAIRLWELFAKANNIHSDASEDIKVMLKEIQRTIQGKAFVDTKVRGKSGPKNKPADIWAWEQVNKEKRPMNQVRQEWLKRDDVIKRDLKDPERQFRRVTSPDWKGKPD